MSLKGNVGAGWRGWWGGSVDAHRWELVRSIDGRYRLTVWPAMTPSPIVWHLVQQECWLLADLVQGLGAAREALFTQDGGGFVAKFEGAALTAALALGCLHPDPSDAIIGLKLSPPQGFLFAMALRLAATDDTPENLEDARHVN